MPDPQLSSQDAWLTKIDTNTVIDHENEKVPILSPAPA